MSTAEGIKVIQGIVYVITGQTGNHPEVILQTKERCAAEAAYELFERLNGHPCNTVHAEKPGASGTYPVSHMAEGVYSLITRKLEYGQTVKLESLPAEPGRSDATVYIVRTKLEMEIR